jgi:hypothetical protein
MTAGSSCGDEACVVGSRGCARRRLTSHEAVGARRLTPTLVDFFSKFRVLDVALGGDHSLVICSER